MKSLAKKKIVIPTVRVFIQYTCFHFDPHYFSIIQMNKADSVPSVNPVSSLSVPIPFVPHFIASFHMTLSAI